MIRFQFLCEANANLPSSVISITMKNVDNSITCFNIFFSKFCLKTEGLVKADFVGLFDFNLLLKVMNVILKHFATY
jgi:hypothetical protein